MKLPYADRVVLDSRKLRDYLLSTSHPVGRFKAAFFATLGYSKENWQSLEADLLNMVASEEAKIGQESRYGLKYEVRGTIIGPSGQKADVVTVWIVLTGEDIPRFVTAFPGEKV